MNQTSHKLQVAALVSSLAVKGALPAPGVIMRAELGLMKSGLDPLVSLLMPCASWFVDDQPAQHSGLGPFLTQNLHCWSREHMSKAEQQEMCEMGSLILSNSVTWGDTSQDYALQQSIFPHIKANELHRSSI